MSKTKNNIAIDVDYFDSYYQLTSNKNHIGKIVNEDIKKASHTLPIT